MQGGVCASMEKGRKSAGSKGAEKVRRSQATPHGRGEYWREDGKGRRETRTQTVREAGRHE
eukprot:7938559-Heterocapsa_arctica.AAC.1